MSKKAYALTIEVQNGAPDCGYNITFTADENFDYRSAAFKSWREDITMAVFEASGDVFGANRNQVLRKLTDDIDGINATYNAFQVKSTNGIPALQIDSVDGRRLEVEFNGSFDANKDINFSRKTLAVPRTVNGHGAGGIRLAAKTDFPFMGIVTAGPARIKAPKP